MFLACLLGSEGYIQNPKRNHWRWEIRMESLQVSTHPMGLHWEKKTTTHKLDMDSPLLGYGFLLVSHTQSRGQGRSFQPCFGQILTKWAAKEAYSRKSERAKITTPHARLKLANRIPPKNRDERQTGSLHSHSLNTRPPYLGKLHFLTARVWPKK